MNILTKYIRAFADSWKAQKQKEKDEKLLNQLIAHIDEDDENRRVYEGVVKSQIAHMRATIASKGDSKCEKCGHKQPKTDRIDFLTPRIAVEVLDNLVVMRNWMGVQPMSGPVGLAYTLQYKTDEEKRLSLEIISHAVEARTLKLAAGWTMEAEQDMLAMHGLNVEDEIVKAVASEIAIEIIAAHLNNIRNLSRKDGEFPVQNITTGDAVDFDRGDALALTIQREANRIAMKTRRGAGNFVIVSPMQLAELQISCKNFTKADDEERQGFIRFVGYLFDEQIRVFCDMLCSENQVTVGYKGRNGDVDVGYAYCPYILLMNTGVVVNPKTFQPVMSMMTREGIHASKNAADYYRTFIVR